MPKPIGLEEMAAVNTAYWVHLYKIQLQSGLFTFKNHEYLHEPMESRETIEATMKATQAGFTESEVLRSTHDCISGRLKQGVLYLFPTDDDVQDFSKTRFNTLIHNNPESIGKYVKSGGKGTDSAGLKKIGNSFIYFRSGRISRNVGDGAKEASQLRSIPVDKVVFDEYDLMDEDVINKARGRMGHSLIKEQRYLSNPTIPGYGIDKLFQDSDQRHWMRRCSACGKYTCAELEFPNCVKADANGKGYIACKHCSHPVGIYPGQWEPLYKGRPIVGRRWSQLTSVFNDPMEILEDYMNPKEGNLGDVVRLRLGLPHIDIEDRLRLQDVYECCTGDRMADRCVGPCAMGVDVGKTKHVVIGTRIGSNQYEVVRVAIVESFNDIHDLIRKYNVRSAVIDMRPYEDEARAFQKAHQSQRVLLCEYSENALYDKQINEKTGVIRAHRTGAFDTTHRLVFEKRFIFPRRSPEIDEFAKQLCATAKRLETNKRTNTPIYRYIPLGAEHYRNALNYFYLAASGGRVAMSRRQADRYEVAARTQDADNNYRRC